MQFTQDELAAIVGTKELELIYLRRENAQLRAALEETRKPKEDAGEPAQSA
ncbi:MAG TPA: hypothetical protein VD931_22770 [Baekduia sp.]|nr:hypothetical protein [Baekduia sp.]